MLFLFGRSRSIRWSVLGGAQPQVSSEVHLESNALSQGFQSRRSFEDVSCYLVIERLGCSFCRKGTRPQDERVSLRRAVRTVFFCFAPPRKLVSIKEFNLQDIFFDQLLYFGQVVCVIYLFPSHSRILLFSHRVFANLPQDVLLRSTCYSRL